ncbi:hypothetical protein Anas_13650, partial [Armadillidium nasatum]
MGPLDGEKFTLQTSISKERFEVKDEPFDIVEAKDESLGIEEDSMIEELVELSSAVDENQ